MARFAFSAFADEAGVSLMEQIEAMKANDIRYFEPRNIDLINTINLGEEKLLEVKKLLDENGIKVGSLGSPIGKYPIYDDFETHLEDFKKAVEFKLTHLTAKLILKKHSLCNLLTDFYNRVKG